MSFKIVMKTPPPLRRSNRWAPSAVLLAAVWLAAVGPAAADAVAPPPEAARRVLMMLEAAGEDYREGVRDGAVVRAVEVEEATAFVEESQQRIASLHLDAATASEVGALFSTARAAIDHKAPAERVDDTLAALRERLAQATGVSTLAYPPAPPSAARGRWLFAENCVSCHGERGDGKGPSAAQLSPPPANFSDPNFMHNETPYDFFHVISLGKRQTAMPAWDATLSVQDRWDLVAYLWTLAPGPAGLAEGQGVYLTQCAGCHGARGDGHTPFAGVLITPAPDLSRPQALAQQTDTELFTATTNGRSGSPMPAFAHTLSADDRWKAVAFLRALSLGGSLPTAGTPGGGPDSVEPQRGSAPPAAAAGAANDVEAALTASARQVDAAVAASGRGDATAAGTAADAYLEFEPLERRLGATAPGLKIQVEQHFMQLRQALRSSRNADAVRAAADAIRSDFAEVRGALQPHTSPYALFLESATIILREGFEIVLVIGALLAYVGKSGHSAMRKPIYGGTAVGVLASLATAALMGELLRLHPSSSDLLEGITMLLAAVVLFWVSYWLISKAEADKWQRYIRGKVQSAVSGRRTLALAGAAFLAVYREGFETVLFYQALYASAPTQSVTVTVGFLAGALMLAGVYVALRRFQVRLPIQQFFFATGLLLYVMAAVFAGQGVHELQDAGVLGVTSVAWIPTIPLLGIFPSLESLGTQAVFVGLLLYATAVTLRRRRRTSVAVSESDAVLAELQALRAVIDAVRQELTQLRASGALAASGVDERVTKALLQVEHLANQLPPRDPDWAPRRDG